MKAIIAICLILILSGCANSPIVISHMSPEELRSVDIKALCNAYAQPWSIWSTKSGKEKLRAELLSRDVEIVKDSNVPGTISDARLRHQLPGGYSVIGTPAFTDQEWQAIDARQVFVGMSENALICSWGLPYCGGISRSSYGPTQYAYQSCEGYYSDFVYVEDGMVTDFSLFR